MTASITVTFPSKDHIRSSLDQNPETKNLDGRIKDLMAHKFASRMDEDKNAISSEVYGYLLDSNIGFSDLEITKWRDVLSRALIDCGKQN